MCCHNAYIDLIAVLQALQKKSCISCIFNHVNRDCSQRPLSTAHHEHTHCFPTVYLHCKHPPLISLPFISIAGILFTSIASTHCWFTCYLPPSQDCYTLNHPNFLTNKNCCNIWTHCHHYRTHIHLHWHHIPDPKKLPLLHMKHLQHHHLKHHNIHHL